MHNVPMLMSGKPRCTLMMHPEDARALGLAEGDEAVVTSRVGQVSVPVNVTDDVMRGVVSLPHGYGHRRDGVRQSIAAKHAGASLNDLTDDQRVDALCGNAAFSGVPVRVTRAS
jgi:anaerobic selenocysteine-containing dehydrogenase